MADNALITYNGIEIYKSDIDILCEEYTETLEHPEILYKSAGFSGLLEYIYREKLKPIIVMVPGKGYNYELLDNIFNNIYMPLCYKYNITPTVIQFTALVRVSDTALTDAHRGYDSQDGSRVNPKTVSTVKNWYKACESALLGRAVNDNGIGAIFALKANYGYRETAPIAEPQAVTATETPEQISARHATAQLPEKPNLDS